MIKGSEIERAIGVMQERGLTEFDDSLNLILVHLLREPITDEALKAFIKAIGATHYHELVGQVGLYRPVRESDD